MGEDCEAMDVILAQELMDKCWVAGNDWSAYGGEASRFKSPLITPKPPGYEHLLAVDFDEFYRQHSFGFNTYRTILL